MRRPLKDKRPLGPFVESSRDHGPAEVAIYFKMKNLAPATVGQVDEAISDMPAFSGPVTGVHGVSDNVVTLQTNSNQTTYTALQELIENIEEETGIDVEDIEVIW